MKFTTLVPVRLNNGKKVSRRQLTHFMREFAEKFGGCSEEGITKGQWIDPADSVHYHDECVRVSVHCDRIMLEAARAAVIGIGKVLEQRAMYFEVRDYDGVQILEIPPPVR